MNMTVLKLGISVFISVIGIYICFNVLTSEIKSSKSITMAGTENSYWSKNKSRSAEAKKDRIMKIAVLLFLVAVISANLLFQKIKKVGINPLFLYNVLNFNTNPLITEATVFVFSSIFSAIRSTATLQISVALFIVTIGTIPCPY